MSRFERVKGKNINPEQLLGIKMDQLKKRCEFDRVRDSALAIREPAGCLASFFLQELPFNVSTPTWVR
jgi:hypothetical protein